MTDTNILQKIVDTAEIDDQVNVIEIGPGIGALTEFYVSVQQRSWPLRLTTVWCRFWQIPRDFDNVTVVNEDILKVDLAQHIQNFKNPDLPIKVVANLPLLHHDSYSHALNREWDSFSEFVVIDAKEVADRISAQPNTKAYG